MIFKFKSWYTLLCSCLILASCGDDAKGDDSEKESNNDKKKDIRNIDVDREVLETTVGAYKFSVPSPVQMAKIIKGSNAIFDENMVNKSSNAVNYTTNYQQALNLGVYGADLGYLIMYDNTADAMNYLSSVNKLTKELGIDGAFDKALIDKFSSGMDNMGNEDSLQLIVAEAYRAGNSYLQTNKSYDIIGLLLTGGFIESLHFACQVATSTKNQNVMNSIGSQKSSLKNLIGLLKEVNQTKKSNLIDGLVTKMIKLQNKFFHIKSEYNYVRSDTDEETRTTTIKSKTNVMITDEQIEEISVLIADIRSDIIQ